MIYPTLGISILAHMGVIATVKAKRFLGFKPASKKIKLYKKSGFAGRMFLSFAIAVVAEVIFLITILSSLAVLSFGIASDKSNFHIIENILYNFEKNHN